LNITNSYIVLEDSKKHAKREWHAQERFTWAKRAVDAVARTAVVDVFKTVVEMDTAFFKRSGNCHTLQKDIVPSLMVLIHQIGRLCTAPEPPFFAVNISSFWCSIPTASIFT
jgi:hypothetical protein